MNKIVELSDLAECIRLTIAEQERVDKAERQRLPGCKLVSDGQAQEYCFTGATKPGEKTERGNFVLDTGKLSTELSVLGWKVVEFFAVYENVGRVLLITNGEESADLFVLGF